jgi:tRNA(Ile2) C34 agmatinyltransferase TiaS
MSFLERGKDLFRWVEAVPGRSVRRPPGCAQCGSRLQMDGQGKFAVSGKCSNCLTRIFEDDEFVEELPD